MHRGSGSDYPRAALPPPRYGPPAAPGAAAPFPGVFNRPSFPPHYPNHVSYPRSVPPPGFQSFSTEQSYQVPTEWTLHQDELQSLEVKKKAEEFLRILEAKDRLKLSSESGDKSARRSSADSEAKRHSSEKHSRGRSRSKSRSRSRGKSRARSRGKSRARSRGRSRARSRSRSRTRSRSRSRGKSRTRAKSRPRSRSRSRGRSLARSKSQPRHHKDSQHVVRDAVAPSISARVPDLFQNLRQVLQSKDLEKHLAVVKNTFMINQTQEEIRPKHDTQPAPLQNLPDLQMKSCEPEQLVNFNPNSILPHERVNGNDGSLPRILSWNDPRQKLETLQNKCVFSSIEDEEEFLYGDEDGRKKPQAVTVPLAQTRPAESPISSPYLSKPPVLQEPKGEAVTSRQPLTPDVSAEECERVKNLLKTIGLHLGQADIVKIATSLKQKQEEQRGANSALRATLETLLNRSKVQKSESDGRSTRSESSHSHRDPELRDKMDEREKERREKQIQKKRKEYLVKELEGLLKDEGSGDLIPVIGFFCQRCEEFFGDLSSAEGHKHTNTHQEQQLKDSEKRQRESKPTERRDGDERSADRKRQREDTSPRRIEDKSRVQETKDRNEEEAKASKSMKKKKKKEKKSKKKEKKKEKKEKEAKKN